MRWSGLVEPAITDIRRKAIFSKLVSLYTCANVLRMNRINGQDNMGRGIEVGETKLSRKGMSRIHVVIFLNCFLSMLEIRQWFPRVFIGRIALPVYPIKRFAADLFEVGDVVDVILDVIVNHNRWWRCMLQRLFIC